MVIKVRSEQADFMINMDKLGWVKIGENEIEMLIDEHCWLTFHKAGTLHTPWEPSSYSLSVKEFTKLRGAITNWYLEVTLEKL